MSKVAFIGLGNMGGPMAENIVDAGFPVTGFDIDDEALDRFESVGGRTADSVEAAVAGTDVVFTSLPTPDAVTGVVDQIEDEVESDATFVDLSTSTPRTTNDIASRLGEQDRDVLGAPVSGGVGNAKEGKITVMVGGPRDAYESCLPLFDAFSSNQFYVGEDPGHGHAVKLLNNYLSFTAELATSEAVVLGAELGLDREKLIEVFNASSGSNSATRRKIPDHVLTGKYDNGFALGLMAKDISLFSQFGRDQEVPLLLGDTVCNLIDYACIQKGPEADETRIYDFFEDMMIE